MTETRARIDVWSLTLEPDARAERAACELLTVDECGRALRFRQSEDRAAFVRTRALARVVLGRALAVDPRALAIVEGRDGKPELAGVADPPHFNVSHSGARALVAVCDSHAVGVDVERVRPLDWREVAEAHFAPAEIAEIAARAPGARLDTFFDYWVAKEAYLKGVGVGLKRRTDDFVVPARDGTDLPVLDDDALRRGPDDPGWYLRRLEIGRGYAAAVAIPTGHVAVEIRSVDALVELSH